MASSVPRVVRLVDAARRSINVRTVGSLWLATIILVLVAGAQPRAAASECDNSATGLVPLIDLAGETYLGYTGGLYPGGSSMAPEAHLAVGREAASEVVPRAPDGTAAFGGAIGLISIGVSNTKIEFEEFQSVVLTVSDLNPALVIVNGAQGSRALDQWAAGPDANPWYNLDVDIRRSGLSPEQVQVAWIKLPDGSRGTADLELDAPLEMARLTTVLGILADRYPNLRLAYLSSRIYAGYSPRPDEEPKAYQSGFTIKWLIERQIDGVPELSYERVPWIGWGPYLWADGSTPRSDGLFYECADMDEDGIHPGHGAAEKVASMLLTHFSTDPTAVSWFLANPEPHASQTTTAGGETPTTESDDATTMDSATTSAPSSASTSRPVNAREETNHAEAPSSMALLLTIGVAAFLFAFLGYLGITSGRKGDRTG